MGLEKLNVRMVYKEIVLDAEIPVSYDAATTTTHLTQTMDNMSVKMMKFIREYEKKEKK